MGEDAVWDTEKGELRIRGKRYTAIDAQSLCDYLNTLVGIQVAEVIMHNLEYRLGKQGAVTLKAENSGAGFTEMLEILTKMDRLSGLGMTVVKLADDPTSSAYIEVTRPSVGGATGAAKSFVFSWWAGALSGLLGKEFDVKKVEYDEVKGIMKGSIVQRNLETK